MKLVNEINKIKIINIQTNKINNKIKENE